MKNFIVEAEDSNIRLDRWFKRHQPQMQHSLLQKLLRKGIIRVNGKKAETNLRVNIGDEITQRGELQEMKNEPREKKPTAPIIIQNPEAELKKITLWENADYIIINKPAGLASQGGSGIKISVDDIIRAVNEKYKLVHRLDKDTSGILVIAKKTTAAAKFGELLKNKNGLEKIYWALVKNTPPKPQGKIKAALIKRGEKNEKVEVDEVEGKFAFTEYRVLEKMLDKFSWLELKPITGRTHQLRVHCAHIGCPIVGDGKYGGSEVFEEGFAKQLHLHARQIIVPSLGINVTAPLPEHMKQIAPEI